jgi:hypothetical protein
MLKTDKNKVGMVVRVSNPSYPRDGSRKIMVHSWLWAKSTRPYLKSKLQAKGLEACLK